MAKKSFFKQHKSTLQFFSYLFTILATAISTASFMSGVLTKEVYPEGMLWSKFNGAIQSVSECSSGTQSASLFLFRNTHEMPKTVKFTTSARIIENPILNLPLDAESKWIKKTESRDEYSLITVRDVPADKNLFLLLCSRTLEEPKVKTFNVYGGDKFSASNYSVTFAKERSFFLGKYWLLGGIIFFLVSIFSFIFFSFARNE